MDRDDVSERHVAISQHWYTCHSMIQGSNENIKEIIGIVSIPDYFEELVQICVTQQ